MREHDLPARIGAEDRGDLDVRIHGEERDPATGVIGLADTLATTRAVRAAVRDAVADGRRALVLGGCCALVPGALAGLRDADGGARGRLRRRPRRRLRRRDVAHRRGRRHADERRLRARPRGLGRRGGRCERRAGRRRRARRARPRGGRRHRRPARRHARRPRGPRPRRAARRRACVPRARGPRSGWAPTAGASGSISTSTCSTSARCRRPTTSCPRASSGTSWPSCWQPLGASPGLAGLSLGCLNPDKDPGGTFTERTCALLAGALAAR